MKLEKKSVRTGILVMLALLACLCLCAGACAEAVPVNTEENGKIVQTVWTENGEPAAGPEGYSTVRYSYRGNEKTEKYYSATGEACMSSEGCYGKKTLTDKGQVTQVEYLDISGERMLNLRGYAMMTVTYYQFGEPKMVTYYGLNKKPVMVPSLGYASVLDEYSNKTLKSRTFRDASGNPVDTAEGYAVLKQKMNKSFQVQRIRYEHADGSPALGPDGWYRCIMERDDKDRITSIKYYDTNENLTDRGASYAWEERTYPSADSVAVTRYDLDGNKVVDRAGVATVVRVMKDDRVERERFLDADGQPVLNELGAGAIVYGYDDAGRLVAVTYQDTDGLTAYCKEGYAGYRDTLDEDGTTLSRIFLTPEGLPAEVGDGYSEIRYVYDEFKNLTGKQFYDADGNKMREE